MVTISDGLSVLKRIENFSVRNYMLEEAQGRYLGILQRDLDR